MKRLSIIIVTHNSEKDIYDCIDSIKEYADVPLSEIELIIVDNNSANVDVMFEKLKHQWGDGIVLIKNTHNGGYGQGNNVGIRASSAPVILIMNPDVRPISPFIQKPVKAFEDDGTLVMYGMKQMLTKGKPSTNSFAPTYMMNGYFRSPLAAICTRLDYYIPRCMWFSGSCFYVRKSMFEDVGLFDESIFMYGEEDDIRYRLARKYGYNFKYDKSIKYLHLVFARKPSLEYEKRVVDAIVRLYEKKGVPPKKTLTNLLRNVNMLLFRASLMRILKRNNNVVLDMLTELRSSIKQNIQNL